jgi:hypothetical protein
MKLIIILIGLLLLIIKVIYDNPVAAFVLATLIYHTTGYLLETANNITLKTCVEIVKTTLNKCSTKIKKCVYNINAMFYL